jgi:sigma-E factor negative regulatory protein RseA
MTQELSTLMDGELDGQQAERIIRGCFGNEELKRKWQDYHVIGDALRGDSPCRAASTRRIMEAIAAEPTVLAPRRIAAASAGRIAFAAAASVATVAVVGWIGLQDRATSQGPVVATSSAPAATQAATPGVMPLQNVNEYLVAHRQLPNPDFYRPAVNKAVVAR